MIRRRDQHQLMMLTAARWNFELLSRNSQSHFLHLNCSREDLSI